MYIKVSVSAGAKKELIEKISDNHFKVSVREPAERNLANQRIIEIFKKEFSKAKRFRMVSGHHSKSKIIFVE